MSADCAGEGDVWLSSQNRNYEKSDRYHPWYVFSSDGLPPYKFSLMEEDHDSGLHVMDSSTKADSPSNTNQHLVEKASETEQGQLEDNLSNEDSTVVEICDTGSALSNDQPASRTPAPIAIANDNTISASPQQRYSKDGTAKIVPLETEEKRITIETETPPEPPYCVLSEPAKISIIIAASFAANISPISSRIYFPALNSLAHDLHVST